MTPAAFSCVLCSDEDCDAVFNVHVATDDTHTVDEEMQVGRECVPDAIRYLEGRHGGEVQVDPLSYLDGAA
jgi:hypothetical protein